MANSPASSLLKKLFTDFSVKITQSNISPDDKQHILQDILSGTKHNDLLSYQNDFSVDYGTKLSKYSYWLGVINTNIQKQAENPTHKFKLPEDEAVKQMQSVEKSAGLQPDDSKVSFDSYNKLQKEKDQIVKMFNDINKALGESNQIKNKLTTQNQAYLDELQIKQKQIEEINSKFGDRRVELIQIKHPDGTVTELDQTKEVFHKQIPLILKLLSARNHAGWPEFLWIGSAPGAGKTHMAKQLAKMLKVPAYVYPCGPTITEGKILGFNNVVNGQFVKGWLYDAYKNGGLVALDEIDLCDASVLGSCNSIENDSYTFGNGEYVERHRDFYLIAFANTFGTGSTRGFQRNVIDAATLDRFTQLKLEYDEEMELALNGHDSWVKYVFKVRKYAEQHAAGSMYITPRASRKGAMYLKAGIDPETVCNMVLFNRCSANIKESIEAECGKFKDFHFKMAGQKIYTLNQIKKNEILQITNS
jgi:cobaltochelatase CobS